MKRRIIICFIILLTLFLSISAISASENSTCDNLTTSDDTADEFLSVDDAGDVDDDEDENKSSTEFIADDKVSYVDYKDKLTIKLTSDGKKLANKKVTVTLNGVKYNKKTDSKGKVSINFKLKTGTYKVKYSFGGDNKYAASKGSLTLKVKSNLMTSMKVVDKKINYREGLKSIFQLKLVDIHGKTISGKKIKIKVGKKTLTAKTDSKGIATFYLSLKEGSHKVEYSFSKSGKYLNSSGSYKVSVKPKMEAGNGYWVNKWDMEKVNLKKLSKLGTKHIFLLHTSISKYGEKEVLKWINKAHKYGMKVHLWMAVFFKNGKYVSPVTKKGKYNYKQMNYIINKAKHYAKLKGVDGIHFDYVRFGGNAYEYKHSVEAVNYFIKKACNTLRSVNPNLIISAAVMPEPTSMKYYYGQDVETMSKYLDAVVPMVYKGNYLSGTKWVKKTTKQFVKKSNGAQIWSGLQTYESDWSIVKLPYNELFKDAKAAKEGGAMGVVLFRWGLSALLNFNKL